MAKMKTIFLGVLFLVLTSFSAICQLLADKEKNSFPKNAIYLENTLFLINAVKYDRNIFTKNNFKLNVGIGVGANAPLFIPFNISSPVDVTLLFGSVHHLELGLHAIPTFWFSKNYKSVDFFGGGETYTKNTTTTPLYFRLGYRYQKEKGLFFKANIGPPLSNLGKNDPDFFNYNYATEPSEFKDVNSEVRPILFLWPSAGVGYSF
jgi:hypothetical protein